MGHCLSVPVEVYDNEHPPTHRVLGNKLNTKTRLRKRTWSSSNAEKSVEAVSDVLQYQNERQPRKAMGFGSSKEVVIIPEATDRFADNVTEGFGKEMLSIGSCAITSPTLTVSTSASTAQTSLLSVESLPLHKDSFELESRLTNGILNNSLIVTSPETTCASVAVSVESLCEEKVDEVPVTRTTERPSRTAQNLVQGRKSTVKSVHNTVMKDFKHPDSANLLEADLLLPASFTPIKQTSLQNKVSVIREEDDMESPSDEEDVKGEIFLRKLQKDLNSKGKISGPLTPVKLRTQWKTTPTSIKVRDSSIWQNCAVTGVASPMLIESKAQLKDSTNAVDDSLVSNFQKLKLQVAVAEQQEKRNQKVLKIEDRLRDVQGYRELWGNFQQIQEQVKAFENRENLVESESPTNEIVYDLEDDGIIISSRKKKGQRKPKREAQKVSELQPVSTCEEDKKQWIFDFQADGLDLGVATDDDDSSQASLSLLSEKNMEVQRRLFAEKRKERKRKKKLLKQATSTASTSDFINAVTVNDSCTNLDNTGDSCRDYGPSNKNRKFKSNFSQGGQENNDAVITDMEVSFHSSSLNGSRKLSVDTDSCSLVSDLADDQSCSISVASSQYSRDNDSNCEINDYRVNRRQNRKHSRQSLDVDKHVFANFTNGMGADDVVERRKAIEQRLLLLNSKQNDSVPESSSRQSHLTHKFNEVVMAAPIFAKQNAYEEGLVSPSCYPNDLNENSNKVSSNVKIETNSSKAKLEHLAKPLISNSVSESNEVQALESNVSKSERGLNDTMADDPVDVENDENWRGIYRNPSISASFDSRKQSLDGKDVLTNLHLASEVADTVKTILEKYRAVEQ